MTLPAAAELPGEQSYKIIEIFPNFSTAFPQFLDLTTSVKNRRVIPTTKGVTNFRKAVVRQLFCQSHCHLPGSGN